MGNDNILVIGIAGGSASGKTTLMKTSSRTARMRSRC